MESNVSAGNVLTKSLLNKVDKAAYQHGGFKTIGGIQKKTALSLDKKTIVFIDQKHIKCDPDKFIDEFRKTMNYFYYDIKTIK